MREAAALQRECDVFCRYLCGDRASPYVQATYARAHELGAVEPEGGATRFDRALVTLARGGPFVARVADAHARVFAKGGLLRRKLVVLVAILECSPTTHTAIDSVTPGTTAGFFANSVFSFAAATAAALALALVLLPVRAWCALGGRTKGA